MGRGPDRRFRASGAALVGRYTYRPDSDEWWWSDTMFEIHGFEPGTVVPTTELVMRHVHPEDVPAAWESREALLRRSEPFSFLHRIRTARNAVRVVLAAGHLDDDDGTRVVHGHLVDITDVRQDAVDTEVDTAVVDFVEHRAAIEQAKGVLASSTASTPTPRGRCCAPSRPTPTARCVTSRRSCWRRRPATAPPPRSARCRPTRCSRGSTRSPTAIP